MLVKIKDKSLKRSSKKNFDHPYHSQKNLDYSDIKPKIKKLSFISYISHNRHSDNCLNKKSSDFLSKSVIHGQFYSKHSAKIVNKYSRASSKNSRDFTIKYLEKYIKQKIIDMSHKIGKEEDIKCIVHNKTAIFSKKYFPEIINDNSSFISNKKESIKRLNDFFSVKKSSTFMKNFKKRRLSDFSPKSKQEMNTSITEKKFKNDNPVSVINFDVKKEKHKKLIERIHRKIEIKKRIYDSLDDDSDDINEKDERKFYILPDNIFALSFDGIIILCSLFDKIYTPYYLSSITCFCNQDRNTIKKIYLFIDIFYILDLLLNFFRIQYDMDFKIIKKNKSIKQYFSIQFLLDLIQAIPFFSIIYFLCKKNLKNNDNYCNQYSFSFKETLLLFFCYIKQLKTFKIIDKTKNSITYKLLEIISSQDSSEQTYKTFKYIMLWIFSIYAIISIYIFIGHQSYPNWIVANNLQNSSYLSLYITSFYSLMVTLTTVGYGDIVCVSTLETFCQILFLAVGVIIYSWLVSNIGNYVKNTNHAAIKLNQNKILLEEIRIKYPEMPFKLYHQISQHLKSKALRQQKCDANILINGLPYFLRSNLLLAMYKQTIDKIKIFNNCQNSDFKLKILNSFIPLFSTKNSLLIHDGELIENIFFVNEGRLSLEATINLDTPEDSIYQILNKKFADINEDAINDSILDYSSVSSHICNKKHMDYNEKWFLLDKIIHSKSLLASGFNETNIGKEIGKFELDPVFEEGDYKFINIINILKNENYGSVYMFLEKPSPLSLRVKSKKAELFLLRKYDAFAISKQHPNIWDRFNKQSFSNMLAVKNLTMKIVRNYCKSNGIVPIQKKYNNISKEKRIIFPINEINEISEKNTTSIVEDNKDENKLINTDIKNNKINDNSINDNSINDNSLNDNSLNDNSLNDNSINDTINKELNQENDSIKNISKTDYNINICPKRKKSNNNNNGVSNLVRKSASSTSTASFAVLRKSQNLETNKNQSFVCQINESNKKQSKFNSNVTFSTKKNSIRKNENENNEYIEIKNDCNTTRFQGKIQDFYSSTKNSNYSPIYNIKTERMQKNSDINNLYSNKRHSGLKNVYKIRRRFIKKLKTRINKLKKEKKYYKNFSKSLSQNFNHLIIEQTSSDKIISAVTEKNKSENNIINNVSLQTNNNNFIFQIPEFSSSESSNNKESFNLSRNFDMEEISISSPIRLSYKSQYKNLNTISFGNYSKNTKLRKLIKKSIKTFLLVNKNLPKNSKMLGKPKYFSSINSEFMDNISINDYLTNLRSQLNNSNKIKKKNKKNLNESLNFSENTTKIGKQKSNDRTFPKKQISDNIQTLNIKSCNLSYQPLNNSQFKDNNSNSLLIKTFKEKQFNNTEFEYENILGNGNNNDFGGDKKYISEQIIEHSSNNNNLTNEPIDLKSKTKLSLSYKKEFEKNNEINNYKDINQCKITNTLDENGSFKCYIF